MRSIKAVEINFLRLLAEMKYGITDCKYYTENIKINGRKMVKEWRRILS
jgi:hypothetical protein